MNCLRLHNFHDLYLKTKISFIRTLCFNQISEKIFFHLSENKEISNRSKSFKKDIILLEKHYGKDILVIKKDANKLENEFLNKFQATDGISDSIRTCLLNYKDNIYKGMFDDIIKLEFIHVLRM